MITKFLLQDVMVLLDLIGTANPKFYSYFPDTYGLYSSIVDVGKNYTICQIPNIRLKFIWIPHIWLLPIYATLM